MTDKKAQPTGAVSRRKPLTGLVKPGKKDTLPLEAKEGVTDGTLLARIALEPITRHASLGTSFGTMIFGDKRPSIVDSAEVVSEYMAKTSKGDLDLASRMLTAQALSLDTLFTEMARRSGNNMGQYPDIMERYMRLALKAQSNCRATLDALAKLHQPREQTVKHVHVNQGGQAVVADQITHNAGGTENGKIDEQSHATGAVGECAALPGPDPLGRGVPIPGCQRAPAV